jgi:hypothetical protein
LPADSTRTLAAMRRAGGCAQGDDRHRSGREVG